MLTLPDVLLGSPQRGVTWQFTGLDRRARIADGAARDMENLSVDDLPVLTVRAPRGKVRTLADPQLLCLLRGREIVADGGKLLIDGTERADVLPGRKCWAVIGGRLCIWPDKLLYNADEDKTEPLGAKQTAKTAHFTNSTLTLDADAVFQKGDGVTISGCKQTYNNRTVVVQEVEGRKITVYDNVFQHGELGSEQPKDGWEETGITLERVVPDLDFVCEKDNRLWGTHDNAICCCKLGDPKNWNVFNGLATDAWEGAVGSDGAFTGIAAFSSHVIAFKEHTAHKVYGQKPSSFQVQVAHIEGVKAGCERSLVNINETIYYLSPSGVMAYSGGIPDLVSPQLADDYDDAAAGGRAGRYYLSARRAGGAHEMLVMDTANGAWVREDGTHARAFAGRDGRLYWLTGDGLWCDRGQTEGAVPWRLTLGPFERVSEHRQLIQRLHVLLSIPAGSRALVEVQFDGGAFYPARRIQNACGQVFRVPIVPRRCEQFAVRLSGVGPAQIRAVVRQMQESSDAQPEHRF